MTSLEMQRPAHPGTIHGEEGVSLGLPWEDGHDFCTFSSLLAVWEATVTGVEEAGFPSSS